MRQYVPCFSRLHILGHGLLNLQVLLHSQVQIPKPRPSTVHDIQQGGWFPVDAFILQKIWLNRTLYSDCKQWGTMCVSCASNVSLSNCKQLTSAAPYSDWPDPKLPQIDFWSWVKSPVRPCSHQTIELPHMVKIPCSKLNCLRVTCGKFI